MQDAELLDTVRKLRIYMATFDNCHMVLTRAVEITPNESMSGILPDLRESAKKISDLLKNIEASKEYRDMMKKYNMKDEEVYPDTW